MPRKPNPETTRKVYQFVCEFVEMHGYSPSYEEIAIGVNLKSKSDIRRKLKALEEQGLLELPKRHSPRGIRIVGWDYGDTSETCEDISEAFSKAWERILRVFPAGHTKRRWALVRMQDPYRGFPLAVNAAIEYREEGLRRALAGEPVPTYALPEKDVEDGR